MPSYIWCQKFRSIGLSNNSMSTRSGLFRYATDIALPMDSQAEIRGDAAVDADLRHPTAPTAEDDQTSRSSQPPTPSGHDWTSIVYALMQENLRFQLQLQQQFQQQIRSRKNDTSSDSSKTSNSNSASSNCWPLVIRNAQSFDQNLPDSARRMTSKRTLLPSNG